jgi:MoaA/NifB/PqqE/SkfB family radical SAM enzyme
MTSTNLLPEEMLNRILARIDQLQISIDAKFAAIERKADQTDRKIDLFIREVLDLKDKLREAEADKSPVH